MPIHDKKTPSAMGTKDTKKVKKEGVEGALDQVYAVQKPYSGCQLTSLVHPIDPLKGLEGSEVMPDQVHGVYHDQGMAQSAAQEMYEAHMQHEQALEEKKHKITEKINKVMKTLEKERAECNELIRENPKDSTKPRQRVAELTHKLDELVNTLERIEKSKKEINKNDKKSKKQDKKKVEESLKIFLKEGFLSLDDYENSPKEDFEYRVVYYDIDDKSMSQPKYQTLFTHQQPSRSTIDSFLSIKYMLGKLTPVVLDKNNNKVGFKGESDKNYVDSMKKVGMKSSSPLSWQAG